MQLPSRKLRVYILAGDALKPGRKETSFFSHIDMCLADVQTSCRPENSSQNLTSYAANANSQTENVTPDGGVRGGVLGLLDGTPLFSSSSSSSLSSSSSSSSYFSAPPSTTFYGLLPSNFTGKIQTPLFPLANNGVASIELSRIVVGSAMIATVVVMMLELITTG